ncbi:anamorsin homolog 2-like isoform X2 [Camellia sinensis]|uniref:anamorsin homolog 2-like isoform X2 n=1 Tax=Camellia sinensis TaxID=4442 RepID=UPI0010356051|nr:anamorsin homolog 2-like isoform X2 [Camellia sinensis]
MGCHVDLQEGSLYFKSSSLSTIISVSEKPGFHTQLWLLELAKVLKPGGNMFLQEPSFFYRNKDLVLEESRACLERNLLFAGFYAVEEFECLDHLAEIDSTSQDFELLTIKAKKTYDTVEVFSVQKAQMHKAENSMIVVDGTSQQQIEDFDDLIDKDTLFIAEDSKMPELLQDESYPFRERIHERNRLYQCRRQAQMTEEQKNREKEKRRQYMQSRRVQPVSYEMPLSTPVSYQSAKESEQRLCSGQQLQESHIIKI